MKKLLLFFCFALIISQSYAQRYELDDSYAVGTGFDGEVNAMQYDNNGKLLVAGDFANYNGGARANLARLNADGTVDAAYAPNPSSLIYDLAVHSNNSVTVVNAAGGLQRFDDNGVDVGVGIFLPSPPAGGPIYTVVAESTGLGVIIGGDFTGKIARLNSDGSLDASFTTNIGTGFNGLVRTIEVMASGQLLVGGDFSSFNGVTRNKAAILNSNGTLYTPFNPGTALTSDVYAVAEQGDGKILVGQHSGETKVFRFNADGSRDFGFNGTAVVGMVTTINDIYTNGTDNIIVAYSNKEGISSLDFTDGSLIDIVAGSGLKGVLPTEFYYNANAIVPANNGSVIVGGDFRTYNGLSSRGIARIATCSVVIDTQPEAVTLCESDNATFTVAASGNGSLSYQWQTVSSNGLGVATDIIDDGTYSGTTTASLTVSNVVKATHNGKYFRCIVTDDDCSSTTSSVILLVNTNQVFTVGPANSTMCSGMNTGFSVTFTGSNGGFQWQEDPGTGTFSNIANGGIYSGATTSNLVLSGITTAMSGNKYRLKSTLCSPAGIFSAAATLTVTESAVITKAPDDIAVCVSGDASFTVEATSANAITYQWQYYNGGAWTDLSNSAIYSGVTESTLLATGVDNTLAELNGATGNKVGVSLRCMVSSNGCTINTGEQHLYIHVEPDITKQPEDFSECVNVGESRSTTLYPTLAFSDSGIPFQWEYDDGTGFAPITDNAVYSGTNSRILTFTSATADYNGKYRVKISNCAATVYSAEASFTLDERPVITLQPVNTEKLVCEGEIVEYTVAATGKNLTYQWQVSGANISDNSTYAGTDSNTLTIDTKNLAGLPGNYRCVISSNATCVVTSSNGNLNVKKTPSIAGAPVDRVVCEGGPEVIFQNAAANFTPNLNTYQWQEATAGSDIFVDITDGEKFAGTNAVKLTVRAPSFSMNGNRYRQSVLGCAEPLYSDPATLTVNQLPLITTSPQSQSVCKGDEVIFTAKSEIGTDVLYQWMVDRGDGYSALTQSASAGSDGFSTLKISSIQATENGNKYKCVAWSANPCLPTQNSESAEATLVVNEVTIQSYPANSIICNGESTSFFIDVLGDNLTYQWFANGTELSDEGVYSGVNTNTLTITAATNLTMEPSITYTVDVEGVCGVVEANAILTIYGTDKPIILAEFNNAGSEPYLYVNNVAGDNYSWYLDGTQIGGGSNTITVQQEGSYTVIVSINGCSSEESDAFVVLVTASADKMTNELQIYPNPVKDKLVVIMGANQGDKQITITGLDGKIFYQENTVALKATIDTAHLMAGVYVVHIRDNKGVSSYKVIKE